MVSLKLAKEEISDYLDKKVEIDEDGNIIESERLELLLVWTSL